MKNIITKAAVTTAALMLVAQVSHAVPITGAFGLTGSAELNGDIDVATGVSNFYNTSVKSDTGVLATYIAAGSPITLPSPWTFDSTGNIPSFWSIDGFTFSLAWSTISFQGGGFLAVTGYGYISGNGYDSTEYSFGFTTQNPPGGSAPDNNPTWTFSASQGPVPDGSTTVLLLGSALSGLALLKRKLVA